MTDFPACKTGIIAHSFISIPGPAVAPHYVPTPLEYPSPRSPVVPYEAAEYHHPPLSRYQHVNHGGNPMHYQLSGLSLYFVDWDAHNHNTVVTLPNREARVTLCSCYLYIYFMYNIHGYIFSYIHTFMHLSTLRSCCSTPIHEDSIGVSQEYYSALHNFKSCPSKLPACEW